jgi:hypothetical protein
MRAARWFFFLCASFVACEKGAGPTSGPTSGNEDAGAIDALPPRDTSACIPNGPLDLGGFSASYVPLESGSRVADKAFYLTTLLSRDPSATDAIAKSAVLGAIATSRDARLRGAVSKCGADAACLRAEIVLSDEETRNIAAELPVALGVSLASFASKHLRASGRFALHASATDAELLSAAWTDTATALAKTFDVYASDGSTLASVVGGVVSAHPEPLAFHRPLLLVVLGALEAKKRDEAARYEPLAAGENAAALRAIPAIDWKAYPYSVIVVPGQGPGTLDRALDPAGQARCDLAVRRFGEKLAPLLAVSGGHVHPDRTPYSEAIEMKKYLLQKGIPENAILVDPHARHTTTNLRNTAREIFRYGIPADRPALVTSDTLQSFYIAFLLEDRCKTELRYVPYRGLTKLTGNDSCWFPSPLSLQEDGRDALDP